MASQPLDELPSMKSTGPALALPLEQSLLALTALESEAFVPLERLESEVPALTQKPGREPISAEPWVGWPEEGQPL